MDALLSHSVDHLSAQRIDRKRLARLPFHRKPSMDYSSAAALFHANAYVLGGIDKYELDLSKQQARVALYNKNLPRAIYHTQLALFITRIRKVKAK